MAVGLAVSLLLVSQRNTEGQTNADGSGAYATGNYWNLFAESGHSQTEIRKKINGAFQQLFHGDWTNQTIYYSAGANSNGALAFITDIQHEDVRTEGLSYGMMIAVQLDKKTEFDALWNWSKTFLYHADPKHPSCGFSTNPRAKKFVAALWNTPAPAGIERYYEGLLYLMALLHCSGEFQIWSPH